METRLADWIAHTPQGKEAEAILRACVHCGFCTATCPTYQLLGDELDGPRGRIYLIKQLLEGRPATEKTRLHLDRCLSCRACETTCPSGVNYHRLLDIGRAVLAERLPRPLTERAQRAVLAEGLSRRPLFNAALAIGRAVRPLLPASLAAQIPPSAGAADEPAPATHSTRRVLLLQGCAQEGLAPTINHATRRLLAALNIDAIEIAKAGCCGALRFHLDDQDGARRQMRALIDAWWPTIDQGAEAIVITASGCGAHLKDYGHLLRDDPNYGPRAAKLSALVRDAGDYLGEQVDALVARLRRAPAGENLPRIAVHTPCSLQHGLKRRGDIERLLSAAGFPLAPITDGHLCCGSAGTYMLTQGRIADELRDRKIAALTGGEPDIIVTANIGCLTHLLAGSPLPVRHWVEVLAERLGD